MNMVDQIKRALPIVSAAIGGLIFPLFGSCTTLMRALLVFMAVDYVSGVLVAAIFKRSGKTESGALSSKAGFLGILRKSGMLLMILVANQLDGVLNTNYIKATASLFLLGNEGLSILENFGLMGVPFPEVLRTALDMLNKKKQD